MPKPNQRHGALSGVLSVYTFSSLSLLQLWIVSYTDLLLYSSVQLTGPSSSSPVLLPRAKNPTSKDGNCGSNSETNATCLTSTFGNCCSEKGFCGKTSAYCSEGCQEAFGSCSSSEDGQLVSTSGSCGATSTSNITCEGSSYGDCCSEKGYCGKNATYCGAG